MPKFNAAFQRWFGDSKVVDENGEPLVVYHWSDTTITEFRPGFDTGMIWFSEHPTAFKGMGKRAPVVEVFLNIRNPLELEGAYSDYTLDQWEAILEEAGVDTAELRFDSGLSPNEEYPFGSLIQHGDNYLNRDGNLVATIMASGFDGVRAPSEDPLYRGETNWVAFRPGQIKSVFNQGTWSREDPDIRRNPSIAEMAVATATARSAGAVGRRALVPRRVLAIARPGQSILDFGSGPKAMHTMMLRDAGLDVTAHDFPANVRQGVHDPNALDWQYDIVMASNVLNVQSSNPMLQETVDQLIALRQPGGVIVANFPESPRKLPGATAGRIEDYFRLRGLQPHRVGGTKQAPVWEIS